VNDPRFVLVADSATLDQHVARLLRHGRNVVRSPSDATPGGVYVGAVADLADAAGAVLAALSGADLVLLVTADDAVHDTLLDDLARLGTVEHAGPALALPEDQVAVLRRLQAGLSLGEAARAEHLSRRTADRRLALARRALGVQTTAEAVIVAARLGLLD
jgi:DNA-binding NarL/FixJ family response regulator